jgi:hypothetical protein
MLEQANKVLDVTKTKQLPSTVHRRLTGTNATSAVKAGLHTSTHEPTTCAASDFTKSELSSEAVSTTADISNVAP